MTAPRWLPYALLVAAVVFGGVQTRRNAYAASESRRLSVTLDSLAKVRSRVDTVHAVQTRVLTRWRDSLVVQRESLTITDTVEVVRFIALQDSTLNACLATVLTCDEKVRVRDAENAALRAKFRADLAVVSAKVPTLGDKARSTALTLVVWEGGKAILRAISP